MVQITVSTELEELAYEIIDRDGDNTIGVWYDIIDNDTIGCNMEVAGIIRDAAIEADRNRLKIDIDSAINRAAMRGELA